MKNSFEILMEQHHQLALEFAMIDKWFRENLKEMQEFNRSAAEKIQESKKLLKNHLGFFDYNFPL